MSAATEARTVSVEVGLSGGGAAQTEIGVTVQRPPAGKAGGEGLSRLAVLYYHGGGFLYGTRDDLPRPYVDRILGAGMALVAIDYPLCPESTLAQSIDASAQVLGRVVGGLLPELGCTGYVLFGRSAGAYLALMMAKRARNLSPELPRPHAVWDFYGYHDLTAPFFRETSAHYAKMAPISEEEAAVLCRGTGGALPTAPVSSAPVSARFALYAFARQTGRWGELLGLQDPDAARALSLSPADIAALPPIFITASTGDNDVPLRQSKALARAAPSASMHQVYYLEHDFDRDTSNPAGMEAYCLALDFLKQLEP